MEEQIVELKYNQVIDYIKAVIEKEELKYNDQINSELELMSIFNVSRHTVRKAIGDLVNEGVLYKRQGKGTFVANPKSVERGKGKLVGVVVTFIEDYIFPDIIMGIDNILTKQGYSIILGHTTNKIEREKMVLRNMLSNHLDALIIEPTKSVFPNPNREILKEFADQGIPIVYIHATYNNLPSSYIVEDDVNAGYIATEHLIQLGHRRIGGFFKNDDVQGHGRYQGFVSCLREYDYPINEDAIVWYGTEDISTVFNEPYIDVALSRLENCTAIVCYNDQIALKLLEIFKQKGIRVPGDYSIVSFDNSKLAQNAEVKLTTVAHPKSALGEQAALTVLELLKEKNKVVQLKMIPELIVRDSTCAPKDLNE